MSAETPNVPFLLWGIDRENILNPAPAGGSRQTTARRVVFCHPSYPITATLEGGEGEADIGIIKSISGGLEKSIFTGRRYTNRYKRAAVWDFGDGTTARGATATHTYTSPGRYTVSCLFTTSERQAQRNGYSVDVIVKEPIPTKLTPLQNLPESPYPCPCGKINPINTLEAQFSTGWKGERKVLCERAYADGEVEETHYSKVVDPLRERYWCIYTKKDGKATPVEDGVLPIDLQTIYGAYYWDSTNAEVRLRMTALVTDPSIDPDDKLLSIRIISPNSPGTNQTWVNHPIIPCGTSETIPPEQSVIGYRAFSEVLYKTDTPETLSRIFFKFPEGEVNTIPVGMPCKAVANNPGDIRTIWTVNGFVHETDSIGGADRYLSSSLFDGIVQGAFIGAYVAYPQDFDFPFYLAKDLDKSSTAIDIITKKGKVEESGEHTPWIYPVEVKPEQGEIDSTAYLMLGGVSSGTPGRLAAEAITRKTLKVPQRRLHHENIENLIKSYTPHEMFNDTVSVKDSLRALFTNREWLDRTETAILGIFDDRVNIDTCHIDALASIMKHMDDPAPEYDSTNLTAVNEIMDFTRLLSMYHTNLTGHIVKDALDISFNGEEKGANTGDELAVDDFLFVNEDGLLVGVVRKGSAYPIEIPSQIIIWDQFTHESRQANFKNAESPSEYDGDEIDFGNGYTSANTTVFVIGDYTDSWGWGLLLPERYYIKGGDASITAAYYKFFILNPILPEYRFGNFAEENTMDGDFLNPEKWDADWQVSYKILLKLMQEASGGRN